MASAEGVCRRAEGVCAPLQRSDRKLRRPRPGNTSGPILDESEIDSQGVWGARWAAFLALWWLWDNRCRLLRFGRPVLGLLNRASLFPSAATAPCRASLTG